MQKTIGIILCCLFLSLLTLDAGYAAKVALPRTGQTTSYAAGDDGAQLKGVAAPLPRFADNGDGTVKDNLTGLIWLKDAGCFATVGGVTKGITAATSALTWANALTWSNALVGNNTVCGLNDSSTAGQWRLPSSNELDSLVDISKSNPALTTGHPFSNVRSNSYWSGSTYSSGTAYAWVVGVGGGYVDYVGKASGNYVWPVRAGQ
ncbi:MAG: DUF1566 domain-containing protein [Desulfuromonadaceae bacterium]